MNIQPIQLSARIQNGVSFSVDLRDRVVKKVDSIFWDTVGVCADIVEAFSQNPYLAAVFILTLCNISTRLIVCCIAGMILLKVEPC